MVVIASKALRGSGPAMARAVTLVEMVLSMTILMIILVSTYSVMLLASRVAPKAGNAQGCTLEGAGALDQLAGDLTYATGITALDNKSITFKVPDRTGDGIEDTLQYSWSGTVGLPLMFSFNGAAAVAIADDVREFQLTARQGSRVPPPVYLWGNETLLISYNFLVNLGSGLVTSTTWYGEYFLPSFASDVQHWKVTKVRFPVRSEGTSDGQALVQIRGASNGLPTAAVLDQAPLAENLLGGAYSWQAYSFSNPPAVSPTSGLCLVVQWGAGATACDFQYQNLLYSGTNASLVTTVNGGTSWSGVSGQSMLYEVYGKVETVQNGVPQNYLDNVRCSLRLGPSASSRVETLVRVLNQPVMP